ncbi:TPA: hypothetical protein I9Z77_003000 [Clostridium perfringens]|nr:hypothetical protein [Clostridium perfringens]
MIEIIYNKKNSKLINKNKKRAKEYLDKDNKYRKYIEDNKAIIKKRIKCNKTVRSVKEAIDELMKVDIRKLIGLDIKLGEEFKCSLDNETGIIAFVADNKNDLNNIVSTKLLENTIDGDYKINEYIRFGKNIVEIQFKKNSKIAKVQINNRTKEYYLTFEDEEYSYGIIDLYEIIMRVQYDIAIKELCALCNIRIDEIELWRKGVLYKNRKILLMLNNSKDEYSYLNKFIGRHIQRFEFIFQVAEECLYKNHNNTEIFSASLDYMSGRMGISKKTLSPIINIFVAIGLLEKVAVHRENENKKLYNDITYYKIPIWNNYILSIANLRCKKFLELKVAPTKVSSKHIKEILGSKMTATMMQDSKAKKICNY